MIKRKIRKWVKEKKLNKIDDFYFQMFVQKIHTGVNFSLSRFGDGEWNAILNVEGENCDGHSYFKDMGEALRAILEQSQTYYLGMQPLSVTEMLSDILPYTVAHNQPFFNADIFHLSSEYGELGPFFNALNKRKVVLVGPEHLGKLKVIGLHHHVIIPGSNCWTDKENTLRQVREQLDQEDNLIVLFSASMAANVYIDILHKEYGDNHSFIDLGSLWEPYVGNANRSYHRRMKLS